MAPVYSAGAHPVGHRRSATGVPDPSPLCLVSAAVRKSHRWHGRRVIGWWRPSRRSRLAASSVRCGCASRATRGSCRRAEAFSPQGPVRHCVGLDHFVGVVTWTCGSSMLSRSLRICGGRHGGGERRYMGGRPSSSKCLFPRRCCRSFVSSPACTSPPRFTSVLEHHGWLPATV